jgi:plastocyanin
MSSRVLMIVLSLVCSAALLRAADPVAPAVDHATAHGANGLKREWIDGVKPGDFLQRGDGDKTVKVLLIAAFTDANHGMNFNGYSHGKAVFSVPTGWKVEVTFVNPSPVPHSAIVVERPLVKRLQMGAPAFDGASVPNPSVGIALKKSTFTFTASEAGEYALACGFPTHAINGHWVGFDVRDDLKSPTLKLGEGELMTLK